MFCQEENLQAGLVMLGNFKNGVRSHNCRHALEKRAVQAVLAVCEPFETNGYGPVGC